MSGICLAYVWHVKHDIISQTYARNMSVFKTFYEIVLGLAYAWHNLSESLMHMPGICLAYAFQFKILPAPPCSNWVAAEHGFWIASVFNDQRSTQRSGFHGAPVQTPGALSLGTWRAQVGPAMACGHEAAAAVLPPGPAAATAAGRINVSWSPPPSSFCPSCLPRT